MPTPTAPSPSAPPAAVAAPRAAAPPMKDVWSRSGSTYRVRAIVLLLVNVLLFAGLGSFAYWLRSGVRFAPAMEGYRDELAQAFLSVGISQRNVSLGSLLSEPISVQNVPMQIPILGLLMAAMIAIPILVSLLYRFWAGLPFIAIVGFLAVMPWLAITLLISCIIASVHPFRTRFRFVSALLGLVPAVVYLLLAWPGTTDVVAGAVEPVDRIKFIAPWVTAIVAATLVCALVLAIARVVDYRPGAISPLLAIMFGLPVALFEYHVGRDELYYRLLEADWRSKLADADASRPLEQAAMEEWLRRPPPRGPIAAIREKTAGRWLFELMADSRTDETALSRHQAELATRCDDFLKYFPDSRYAANALYLKATALDSRVDPEEFARTKWIRFYDDVPSVASWHTWNRLAELTPDSLLGAAANLRLARFEARECDVERALDRLGTLLRRMDRDEPPGGAVAESEGPLRSVLTRDSAEASLGLSSERTLLDATALRDLLARNADPLYGYEPLCGSRRRGDGFRFGLLDLLPRDGRYVEDLNLLRHWYPHAQIEDNIDLEIAKAAGSPGDRIARLEALIAAYADGDAAPEALFRLALEHRLQGRTDREAGAFDRLYAGFRDSVWARQAARYEPRAGTRVTRAEP